MTPGRCNRESISRLRAVRDTVESLRMVSPGDDSVQGSHLRSTQWRRFPRVRSRRYAADGRIPWGAGYAKRSTANLDRAIRRWGRAPNDGAASYIDVVVVRRCGSRTRRSSPRAFAAGAPVARRIRRHGEMIGHGADAAVRPGDAADSPGAPAPARGQVARALTQRHQRPIDRGRTLIAWSLRRWSRATTTSRRGLSEPEGRADVAPRPELPDARSGWLAVRSCDSFASLSDPGRGQRLR